MSSGSTKWTSIEAKADPKFGKPCARSSHGLSVINKGTRLILYGGEHVARTPILNDEGNLWIADLNEDGSEGSWRCIPFKAEDAPPARVAHAQAAYDDKTVYIFGGRAGISMQEMAMNDLWKLDASGPPGTEKWELVNPSNIDDKDAVPEARSFHKMICIGSKLYTFGGCTATSGRTADLYCYDVSSNAWKNLGKSALRGRGGPNVLPFDNGKKLGVIAGFAGEETSDGQLFDIKGSKWEEPILSQENALKGLRARSVCVSGSFPALGLSVLVGGEVNPSDIGHEGAGAFENDIVLLDEKNATLLETIRKNNDRWPETRGWSDATTYEDTTNKIGSFFIFGGLSGDDESPKRLDDLWKLEIAK